MQQTPVNKDAGQQPPPLAAEGKWAKVRTPMHQILARRTVENRNSRKSHAEENGDVDPEDGFRHNVRSGLPPQPGRSLDALDRVFRFQTPLGSFVLNAPRTDLLPKRKGRKVTAAFDAIRHGIGSLAGSLSAPREAYSILKVEIDEEPEYSLRRDSGIHMPRAVDC